MSVVIVGAGIMGVSTAYFLAKRRIPSTIIEQNSLAAAASGRAGGFLAKDWCSHYEADVLAQNGFDLHMKLMEEFGLSCGYRRVDTYSVSLSPGEPTKAMGVPPWIHAKVRNCSKIGDTRKTAQVHPKYLVETLFNCAQELTNNGTKLVTGRAIGLEFSQKDLKVTGVNIVRGLNDQPEVISASVVVLTTGPWSSEALSWLPSGCINSSGFRGHRAHSVILKPLSSGTPIDASCLFMDYNGSTYSCSPEVYPRPDNTIYICGLSDGAPVPNTSEEVEVESWRCARLRDIATDVIPVLKECETVSEQACYLPLSPDGVPVIGRVPGVQDVYMATGHSCWGILTGPITGRLLAAYIYQDFPAGIRNSNPDELEKAEELDCAFLLKQPHLDAFDPKRFAIKKKSTGKIYTTKRQDL